MITFKNIAIGYRQPLFEVEELTINQGQLVSLIGPNGSGKTTFLNTLLGITKPLKGEIAVEGFATSNMSQIERVKTFSHVASKFEGVNNLTVFELIALGRAPYTNLLNVLRKEDHEIINTIIEQLNIEHLKNKYTTSISDGERQIAMIGKALAQQSKIIILDEPTAFLDYANRIKIIKLLKDIALNQGKLILLSTHNIELSLAYSDLILAVTTNTNRMSIYNPSIEKETLLKEVFHVF